MGPLKSSGETESTRGAGQGGLSRHAVAGEESRSGSLVFPQAVIIGTCHLMKLGNKCPHSWPVSCGSGHGCARRSKVVPLWTLHLAEVCLCVESPLDLLGLPIYVLILGLGLLSPESVVGGVQGLVLGKGRPSTYYEELAGKGLT